MISTREIGAAAVEAFNRLTTDSYLAGVPAVLLVSPRQADLVAAAKADARRKVVSLPLQQAELTRAIDEILQRTA